MAVLTKEYFDQQFKRLVTQEDFKDALEEGFDKQAILINNAFQTHSDHFDKQINGLDLKIDGVKQELKADIGKIDTRLQTVEIKLDRALHTEYVNLEVRVKRIEQKIGLKTISESV